MSIPSFFAQFSKPQYCFILMQTLLTLDIWLQSYEEFVTLKNNIRQKNLKTVFDNISNAISPTSDSFILIMSHVIIIVMIKDQI